MKSRLWRIFAAYCIAALALSCVTVIPVEPVVPPEPDVLTLELCFDGSVNMRTAASVSLDVKVSSPDASWSNPRLKNVGKDGNLSDAANFSVAGFSQAEDFAESGEMSVKINSTIKVDYVCDKVILEFDYVTESGKGGTVASRAFDIISYKYAIPATGLATVIIDTPGAKPISSKSVWTENISMIIVAEDGTVDYNGTIEMKGRGNSTWNYPKKPYSVRLPERSEILGMPKHKRWCLMANWMDRTLIRNAVAFEISRCTELAWTPSGRFVELVFNGRHVGNYYLCEQIRIDKNRVAINEMSPEDTDPYAITGGYIFELDTNFDEQYRFTSSRGRFPWQFKHPGDLNADQYRYGVDYVNAMELALYDSRKFSAREFEQYLDLESMIDWFFVNELTMNEEIKHPKSVYFNKDLGGKLKAGPVWDFDWGTFMPSTTSTFQGKSQLYYSRLFKDKEFVSMLKQRWNMLKPGFETIPSYVEELSSRLQDSDRLNIALWPISQNVNGDEQLGYDAAVNRLISAYKAKLKWMDTQINAL